MARKKTDISIRSSAAEYLTFVAASGGSDEAVEMRYEDENLWLTQKMMAVLYDVDVRTINDHIKKVLSDGELTEEATIRKFRIVQTEGNRQVNREVLHYSLQMVISVGFKVNSERAVQFRKWVNGIAHTYTIKGWVMDEERLKNNGSILTKKYFEEQLEKVREIRASERMFYQKITDLYATAIDYDRTSQATRRFYATVQNKLHYAVHGHTAAEVIFERADATRPHMGLTAWKDAPHGKIQESDVVIAKNYLTENEMAQLLRMVTAFLDLAEAMALRNIPIDKDLSVSRLQYTVSTGSQRDVMRSRYGLPNSSERLKSTPAGMRRSTSSSTPAYVLVSFVPCSGPMWISAAGPLL